MKPIYCINPQCDKRANFHKQEHCENCGTSLLIQNRYTLIRPLRDLDELYDTEIFEIIDHRKQEYKVLKLLRNPRSRSGTARSQLVEMLQREAEILQHLYHPGIPKVEWDGYFSLNLPQLTSPLYCLIMEKIPGQNLEHWLAENGKISQKTALNWLKQLIQILENVHQEGFFHRDIKPSNIMLKPNGELVLIDFGTARPMSETYIARIRGNLKITGIISGGYTPPEQLNYRAVPQSDYYALGRTFVHLLTEIHPIDLPTDKKTGRLLWHKKAPQISKPLADFIDELMAEKVTKRPQTAQDILPYLNTWGLWRKLGWRTVKSPQFERTVIAILLIGILGGLAYLFSRPSISEYYLEKGAKLHEQGKVKEAYQAYQDAEKYNPKDARIYSNLGFLCQYSAEELNLEKDCALEYYQKAKELSPNDSVIRYNLGELYDIYGHLEQAQAEYEFVKDSDPFLEPYALSNLARLEILEGNLTKAISLSQKALKKVDFLNLEAEDKDLLQSALHRNLGWAYLTKTDYNQAKSNLERSLDLNPQRTDAYCLLAQVLELQGNTDFALEQWRNCLRGESDNQEVKVLQTLARQRLNATGELHED